jgi:hypothetical protein
VNCGAQRAARGSYISALQLAVSVISAEYAAIAGFLKYLYLPDGNSLATVLPTYSIIAAALGRTFGMEGDRLANWQGMLRAVPCFQAGGAKPIDCQLTSE